MTVILQFKKRIEDSAVSNPAGEIIPFNQDEKNNDESEFVKWHSLPVHDGPTKLDFDMINTIREINLITEACPLCDGMIVASHTTLIDGSVWSCYLSHVGFGKTCIMDGAISVASGTGLEGIKKDIEVTIKSMVRANLLSLRCDSKTCKFFSVARANNCLKFKHGSNLLDICDLFTKNDHH